METAHLCEGLFAVGCTMPGHTQRAEEDSLLILMHEKGRTYFHQDCDEIQKPQKITRPLFEALSLHFKAVRENRATFYWGVVVVSLFIC